MTILSDLQQSGGANQRDAEAHRLNSQFPVGLAEIRAAQRLLAGESEFLPGRSMSVALRTPLVYCEPLSQQLGCRVWLKLENLQRTGSYKIRGAFNNIANLSPETRDQGLITASAGNHAQGVAAAASIFGVAEQSTVFVPIGTPRVKQENTRAYGVEVRETGESFDLARETAYAESQRSDRAFVEPFDDWNTIAGQGTIGLEIAEDLPSCKAVLSPVGGGGLISGVALALGEILPDASVIGAQASGSAAMLYSLEAGEPTALRTPPTTQIADGIKVRKPGERTFAVVNALLGAQSIVTVPDIETVAATADLMVYAKMIAEGAGAVSVAALREIQMGRAVAVTPFGRDDDIVAIVSGGNIDPSFSWRILYEQTVPNLMTLRVAMPDRPGELLRMLGPIARQHVNIIDVDVNRLDSRPRMGERIVELCVAIAHQTQADELIASLNGAGYHVLVSHWQNPETAKSGYTLPSSYSQVRVAADHNSANPAVPVPPLANETTVANRPRADGTATAGLRIELFRLTDVRGRPRPNNTFLPDEPIYLEVEIRNSGKQGTPAGLKTGFFADITMLDEDSDLSSPDIAISHGPFSPRKLPFRYGSWPEGPKSERFRSGQKSISQSSEGTYRAAVVIDVDDALGLPVNRRTAAVDYVISLVLPQPADQTFEDAPGTLTYIINKKRPLPFDYAPSELRAPRVSREFPIEVVPHVAHAVEAMFEEAQRAGINLRLISGYRSAIRQRTLHEEMAGSNGVARADRLVARPGYSEHQTGLAVDIGDADQIHHDFSSSFASTLAGGWLHEHAPSFGFHLRYTQYAESITGFAWEPWHFRFVGQKLAQILSERQLTLEEYFGVEGGDYRKLPTERNATDE